jgi:hypothetical protein
MNKTVTRLEKLDGIAVITFHMSFALAAMLTVFSTWISLISMLLAYLNRPVNINAFINFANPEEEMTIVTRKGRSIVDAGYYRSIRVVACTDIQCTTGLMKVTACGGAPQCLRGNALCPCMRIQWDD